MVNTEIFPLRSQYARTPAALTPLGSGNLQAREGSTALAGGDHRRTSTCRRCPRLVQEMLSSVDETLARYETDQ